MPPPSPSLTPNPAAPPAAAATGYKGESLAARRAPAGPAPPPAQHHAAASARRKSSPSGRTASRGWTSTPRSHGGRALLILACAPQPAPTAGASHPCDPPPRRILACLYNGHVYLWNYAEQVGALISGACGRRGACLARRLALLKLALPAHAMWRSGTLHTPCRSPWSSRSRSRSCLVGRTVKQRQAPGLPAVVPAGRALLGRWARRGARPAPIALAGRPCSLHRTANMGAGAAGLRLTARAARRALRCSAHGQVHRAQAVDCVRRGRHVRARVQLQHHGQGQGVRGAHGLHQVCLGGCLAQQLYRRRGRE